jgi:hypothetical protein
MNEEILWRCLTRQSTLPLSQSGATMYLEIPRKKRKKHQFFFFTSYLANDQIESFECFWVKIGKSKDAHQ